MITAEQAITALREVVAGNEDYVYQPPVGSMCVYVHDGKPSCLVAQVLSKLGVGIDDLGRLDHKSTDHFDSPVPVTAYRLSDHMPIEDRASGILGYAQSRQDLGETWGEALAAAERVRATQVR